MPHIPAVPPLRLLTAFPGTPLYARLKREGHLLGEAAWERCTLFDVNYVPRRMSPEELREGFHRLAARLYAEDLTSWRRENFNRKFLRPARHDRETPS